MMQFQTAQQQPASGSAAQQAYSQAKPPAPLAPMSGGYAPQQQPSAPYAAQQQAPRPQQPQAPYATPFQTQAPTGGQWQPQQPAAQGGGQWQPPWQRSQAQGSYPLQLNGQGQPPPAPPQQQPTAPPAPQQSIAQGALGGGPGQTQSFLQALQQAGAGSNNSFLAAPTAPQQQGAAPLLGAPAGSNGAAGQVSYAGGFNQGLGGVSYNSGLGASGGSVQQGAMSPGTSTSGQLQYSAAPTQSYTPQAALGGASQQVFSGGAAHMPGPSSSLAGQAPAAPPPTNQWAQNAAAQGTAPAPLVSLGNSNVGSYVQARPAQMTPPVWSPASANAGLTAPTPAPGMLPGMLQMSDERAKTAIAPAGKRIASFLDAIGAHSYEYRDKTHGEGRYVSPMAQELRKTEIGRSAVIDRPDGLMEVEYGRLIGANLAASAVLHQRLKKLEKKEAKRA